MGTEMGLFNLFTCIISNVLSQICAKEITGRIIVHSFLRLRLCFVSEQIIQNICKKIKLPCILPYECDILIRLTYTLVTNISTQCVFVNVSML
jgi:hypothetical protein